MIPVVCSALNCISLQGGGGGWLREEFLAKLQNRLFTPQQLLRVHLMMMIILLSKTMQELIIIIQNFWAIVIQCVNYKKNKIVFAFTYTYIRLIKKLLLPLFLVSLLFLLLEGLLDSEKQESGAIDGQARRSLVASRHPASYASQHLEN